MLILQKQIQEITRKGYSLKPIIYILIYKMKNSQWFYFFWHQILFFQIKHQLNVGIFFDTAKIHSNPIEIYFRFNYQWTQCKEWNRKKKFGEWNIPSFLTVILSIYTVGIFMSVFVDRFSDEKFGR